MKTCTKCKKELAISEFYRRGEGYRSWCKQCQKDMSQQWRRDNPERFYANLRKSALKSKYGMTSAQYNEMLQAQNGKCAICLTDQPGRSFKYFHVDHNHETGQVRALLCADCNNMIGYAKENADILNNAVKYLDMFDQG